MATTDAAADNGDAEDEEAVFVDSELVQKIKKPIAGNPVVVFLKGNPDEPLCGFSSTIIKVLDREEFEDYT